LLAREIRDELARDARLLGLPEAGSGSALPTKDSIRKMHRLRRAEVFNLHKELLASHAPELENALADGSEVNPNCISPVLTAVRTGSADATLFRLASLYWSVPVSNGYGRRMRILVKDRQNGRLIGLIALTDPVFNLRARDDWIGWSAKEREVRLRLVMDACVLGAMPPYSFLIGGKLVAALAASNETREIFKQRYARAKSEILKRRSNTELALLTTTSALGKSSVYDRLSVLGKIQFIPVGPTQGYGHFHVSEKLFQRMRTFLDAIGHPYARGYRFGQGPNWRMRVIREAVERTGSDPEMLKHGIRREVYVVPLGRNAKNVLSGEAKHIRPISASASEISIYCKNRWMIPRALRDERYLSFRARDLVMDLTRQAGIGEVKP
jgi:hypothetical protein